MAKRSPGGAQVVVKYVLLQIPGWVAAILLLAAAVRWWNLSERVALALFGIWVLKDAALYPVLRVAYEIRGGSGGADALVGARGIAKEPLDPSGYVQVGAELWRAEVASGQPPTPPGAAVRVRAVSRLTLLVEPEPEDEDRGERPSG